ncbi:MAG: M18 family aminopeptidase [Halioglobus sp.]|nr:M18 family aminopeptidase [Halioglobus sp.]
MTQDEFNAQLCAFLAASPTPFHAVAAMSAQLRQAGFEVLREGDSWSLQPGGRYFITRNDSSIIALVVGRDSSPTEGLRMVGAHTDSPCLMVKPSPEVVRNGYFQLGVEVYGGALLNPWFDRDLSLAGRVGYQCEQGRLRSALVDFRRPLAVIPSLAIHLDREANSKRSVNAQSHLPPLLCRLEEGGSPDFRSLLRSRLEEEHPDRSVQQVLDYELSFYDTQAPAVIGLEGDFIASARLDNLLSCFTAMQALLQADGSHSALLVCNDHEEVGSQSAAGAQGPFLKQFIGRLARDENERAAMLERSMLISTDNAHGIHPNYAERHDENHGPLLNAGPVIKVNASQRYATNSQTSSLFRMLCAEEDVPVQTFVVRSDMGCGSTIGPITAGVTGVQTLDIGVPTFAMHSVRELAGSADAWNLSRVLRRFYGQPGPLAAS